MESAKILNLFEAWSEIINGKVIAAYAISSDVEHTTLLGYYKRDKNDKLAFLSHSKKEWANGLIDGTYLRPGNAFKVVPDPLPDETRKFTVAEVTEVEQYQITKQNAAAAFNIVKEAHDEAIEKYPWWPINVYVGNSIIAEEFGEAVMASLDLKFKNHQLKDLIKEHGQAAAMHVRQLQHILNVVETLNEEKADGAGD